MRHKNRGVTLPLPIWLIIDIALAGAALCAFALFDHVIPREDTGLGISAARPTAAYVTSEPTLPPTAEPTIITTAEPTKIMTAEPTASLAPSATASPTPEPTATPDPVGYFGTKFEDKFITGDALITSKDGVHTYESENISITCTEMRAFGSNCYFADIYVRDISFLRSGFAKGQYGKSIREMVVKTAVNSDAVIAINGDYYGARSAGVVIRNGVLYRDTASDADICVIYWDGSMTVFDGGSFDAEQAIADGAYQAWCFGPGLLSAEGEAKTKFHSTVSNKNPRTAIGYYEPGHYCFLVVDGRSKASEGMTLAELSQFMKSAGCVQAYNLDGGQTSVMVCGSEVVSVPYDGGRPSSDIIYIGE